MACVALLIGDNGPFPDGVMAGFGRDMLHARLARCPARLTPTSRGRTPRRQGLSLRRRLCRAGISKGGRMCRSIKTLFNFDPPATDDEVRAAALQFVRKLSGTTRPSRANAAAFERAVDRVAAAARELLDDLVTTAPARDRAVEAAKGRARSEKRFGAGVRQG